LPRIEIWMDDDSLYIVDILCEGLKPLNSRTRRIDNIKKI
jgi:hypothetical protein